VLIGAGIGITPLLSMASALLQQPGDRQVILFYGVRNSREHAFRDRLQQMSGEPRLRYLPCYSQPLPTDQPHRDYVVPGRIDTDLIRRVLPHPDFPCYICGPGEFMDGIVAGLRAWGVAEQDLHFEAFGPSTVKRAATKSPKVCSASLVWSQVSFQTSGVAADWDGTAASLLELAEAAGVSLPSGCRAGNCGMCAVRLVAGKVRYAETPAAPLDAGFCLACVAQPDSPEVVIDA
jgi:ferredoxin-NADP reductase